VACHWEPAGNPLGGQAPPDQSLLRLRQQLDDLLRESPGDRQARFAAITSCLAALGREPGSPCMLEDAYDGGWVAVRSDGVAAACTVTDISGVPTPVSVAVASRLVPARTEQPASPAAPGQDRAVTANGSKP
jgi:hypothetical protein